MMLANVAWILASQGKRVLTIDWDLEAPGLHRYFQPFLIDKDLTASPGVIDFVLDYARAALTPPETEQEKKDEWYLDFADILRYTVSLNRTETKGYIDLVPAGKQGSAYATRVNSFDWSNFYERLGGGAILEAAKKSMRKEYDYVLIDSRTGVSDTSGICTIQMPDALVVLFTLNNQSINGAAAVATSVRNQRKDIEIFPVPSRVDYSSEKEKVEAGQVLYRTKFAAL